MKDRKKVLICLEAHPSTHEAAVLEIFIKPRAPKLIHNLYTQEAAVMKIPIPMANFFSQKVVRDTLKMVPN